MNLNDAGPFSLALGAACALCLAGNLQAAEIQGVTIAAYSGQSSAPPVLDAASNLVSSAGLFGDVHVNVPGGAMWFSGAGQPGTNFVTFNLGGVYTLNAMKVWNYNDASSGANANIGVSNAAISYSVDGVNFTTNIPSQNFIRGQGLVNTFGLPFAQTITMPSPVTAQYVRINVTKNWAGNTTSGAGLSKVRFISSTNAPTVLSASENYGSNQVTVLFSESVDVASATNPANYVISGSPAATISSVSTGEYADRVVLHTSPLTGNGYSVAVSGVYDEALTAAVTNNSTVAVKSEVFLWLQADQGVTTTPAFGGNMLTAWNDQSPFSHNAQPANLFNTYTNQPFLVNSVINGRPAIAFYGTNVMQIPNDPANPINGDMTLFVVLEKTTTTTVGDPISKMGGFNGGNNSNVFAAPFDCRFDATGDGRPAFSFGNGNLSPVTLTSAATITASTPLVAAFSVTATNSGSIVVNGSQLVVGAFTAAPQDGGNPIYLGVRGDGLTSSLGTTFSGYIAEVMLIRGTITPNDFANIDNYLSAKYGVTLKQPTIYEQPASLTAQDGQQATFWVGATNWYNAATPGNIPSGTIPLGGGLYTPPLAYQWLSNGVAIPGATNAVYTTPNLTASANNANYTVTVSNTLGSAFINSAAATLTVVPDTTAPVVASASKTTSSTSVLVVFSEAVDSVTGLNPANYSLSGGVSVVSAAAGSSLSQVILTTSTLDANTAYVLSVQNVQDLFNNTMAPAAVSVMPAGMTMWLRGDSGVITNGSAVVDAWLDQTGNGNNAVTYAVPVNDRPNFGADQANNQPAVTFTAGNKPYMIVNNSPSVALTSNLTIYLVLNASDYTTFRQVLSKTTGGNAGGYEVNLASGSGRLRFSRGAGGSPTEGTAQSGSASAFTNAPCVICDVGGPGLVVNQYLNGTTVAYTGAFSVLFGDNGTPLYIGTRNSFDLFMNGDIQEVMLFSNSISAGDRTNVDNYLGAKYFSFTSTGPTNITVIAGATATFSVSASQGSAHFAYQWQENGTNIPGANGPSYTTGPVSTSDNGDTFSVLINVPGTTTTNLAGPATLTVISVPPVVQTYGAPFWETNIIVVNFQTPLNPTIATTVTNYILDNGATVLSATLVSPTEVLLTTTPLTSPPYTLTIQNLQDKYGSVMATTNLANASVAYPNMALWLRADQGISAQNGDPVGEWDDQSGNMNNFIGDAGFEPTFVTNAVNGLPALLFNGTNQTYMYNNSGSASLALTGDMTIFAIMNFTTYLNTNGGNTAGGGGEIISKNDPLNKNVPSSYDYYVYYGGAQTPMFLRGNGTTSQTPFAGGANSPSTGVWHELSAMSQGNLEWHRLDGYTNGAPITWSLPGGPADTGGLVIIGERTDGGVRLTGEMAELIVVSSAVPTNDVTAIETYLGNKYNLIASPRLAISTTNANAVVSWQNPQWSFILQSTPSLSPASWNAVTNGSILINNTNAVILPMGANPMFYRLKSQSQ